MLVVSERLFAICECDAAAELAYLYDLSCSDHERSTDAYGLCIFRHPHDKLMMLDCLRCMKSDELHNAFS